MKFVAACVLALATTAFAAGTWSVVSTLDDVAISMQFVNETTGYLAGESQSNPALSCLVTHDGGKTFTTNVVTSSGLLPLGIAVGEPNVLVAGLFLDYISHDGGQTFTATKGDHVQSQDQVYANGMFFSVGNGGGNKEGVCVSTDGGTTFKAYYADVAKTSARYGAFPSKTTWYLSMGEWPANDDDQAQDEATALQRRLASVPPANGTGWKAQIVKSADAGASWTSAFYDEGSFYFNEIDCEDENTCCAAGESDETSPSPGVRIYCTTDGTTWNKVYFDATTGGSLMTMQSLGGGMWVAGGTFANGHTADPGFLFSEDNGKTWTLETVTNVGELAVISSWFVSRNTGFALGIDNFNSERLLKYTSS